MSKHLLVVSFAFHSAPLMASDFSPLVPFVYGAIIVTAIFIGVFLAFIFHSIRTRNNELNGDESIGCLPVIGFSFFSFIFLMIMVKVFLLSE